MTPLDRRGFMFATLGCLALGGLMIANMSAWGEWLGRQLGHFSLPGQVTAGAGIFCGAGVLVFGIWGWFAARRFLALLVARWPTMVPVAAWTLASVALVVAMATFGDPMFGSGFDNLPDDPAERERLFRDGERVEMILRYVSLICLGLMALAILVAAGCTWRGLGRDPVPVEDHFA